MKAPLKAITVGAARFSKSLFISLVWIGSLTTIRAQIDPDGTGWVSGHFIGPGVDLSGADLSGADLTGANLTSAILADANLYSATLTDSDLRNANLCGVKSGGVTGNSVYFPEGWWRITGGYLIGPGADLSNANLEGLSLSGANLAGANLDSTILTNTTLSSVRSGGIRGVPSSLPAGWRLINGYLIGPGASLGSANLSYADLTSAILTNASLYGVSSGGIVGVPASLPAEWRLINGHLVGPGANLQFANLDLADLTGANLSGADLSDAKVRGVLLDSADLSNANLSYTDLNSSSLINANLSGATLSETVLVAADFTGANLSHAGIFGYFDVMDLSHTSFNGADLSGAYISYVDLYDTDFNAADLSGVRSDSIFGITVSLPQHWRLVNNHLVGPEADLTGAYLASAVLTGQNLTNAVLTRANLSGTSLTNANLAGVISGGIIGVPSSLPAGWQLVNGYLIGPGANLAGVDFTGVDLTGVDASGTYLEFLSQSEQEQIAGLDYEITALQNELATNYTLAEIQDLRSGSTMITVSNGSATIGFNIDQSINLIDWTELTNTTSAIISADEITKFFRFKMRAPGE